MAQFTEGREITDPSTRTNVVGSSAAVRFRAPAIDRGTQNAQCPLEGMKMHFLDAQNVTPHALLSLQPEINCRKGLKTALLYIYFNDITDIFFILTGAPLSQLPNKPYDAP